MISKATDIWAVGVLTYMMVFGRYPFLNEILLRYFPSLSQEALDTRLNAEKLNHIDINRFIDGFKEVMLQKEIVLDLQSKAERQRKDI